LTKYGKKISTGINGRIILKWILKEIGWEDMAWIFLAHERGSVRLL
jgi:hypothetical protein